MINFYCPEFFHNLDIYKTLIRLKEEYSYVFNEDVNIEYIFGNFPGCSWNGGGYSGGEPVVKEVVEKVCEIYDALHIKLQITMTNPLLEEQDKYDRYANMILSVLNDNWSHMCEILVSVQCIEDYIRETYPNLIISRSIVNTPGEFNFHEQLKKYHHVVLPIRYNRNIEFLNSFTEEEKSRLEILVSDPCSPDCPVLYDHYKDFAKMHLYEKNPKTYVNNCKYKNVNHILSDNDNQIYIDEIMNFYVKKGFSEFKLSGRGKTNKAILVLVKYLIKPKYQFKVLEILLTKEK